MPAPFRAPGPIRQKSCFTANCQPQNSFCGHRRVSITPDYYGKFKHETSLEDLFSFAKKKRAGRSGRKYRYLSEYITENHLEECQTKGNVIYILPNCDFPDSIKISDNGFDSITFSDIVNRMEKYATDDELLSAFIHFLQKHQ